MTHGVFKLRLPVIIEFKSESVQSPKKLQLDDCDRHFLFGLFSLQIDNKTNSNFSLSPDEKDNVYTLGEVIDFTGHSQMRPILSSDWHFYELDGVWSSKEDASIYFNLLNKIPESKFVILFMVKIPSTIALSVNNIPLDTEIFTNHGVTWCRSYLSFQDIQLPCLKITLTAPLILESQEKRKLGIKLMKMIIQQI